MFSHVQEHPRNSQEHPRTPKIAVSGQTAHELTKPKSEDLWRFQILHKTFADHPEIPEHFKNAVEY